MHMGMNPYLLAKTVINLRHVAHFQRWLSNKQLINSLIAEPEEFIRCWVRCFHLPFSQPFSPRSILL